MPNFDIEQDLTKSILGSIINTNLHHAYIFEGCDKEYLQRMAHCFAVAIQCEKKEDKPCKICESCLLSSGGNNPDLISLSLCDTISGKSIGVEDIRLTIKDAYIKPFRAEKKVYIINDADMLTTAAQNSMLKILEEPPSYIIFILVANNIESLLDTVRSRTQHIRLDADKSTHVPIPDEIFDLVLNITHKILRAENTDIFLIADLIEQNKAKTSLILELLLSFSRDMLMISIGGDNAIISNVNYFDKLKQLSNNVGQKRLLCLVESIIRAQKMQSRYVSNKALVYNMLINMWEEI